MQCFFYQLFIEEVLVAINCSLNNEAQSPKDKKKPKAVKPAPIEEKILMSRGSGHKDCNG